MREGEPLVKEGFSKCRYLLGHSSGAGARLLLLPRFDVGVHEVVNGKLLAEEVLGLAVSQEESL